MNKELKPCPFCGGEAVINTIEPHKHEVAKFMPDYPGGTFIECTGCTCALSGETEEKAIKAWNTRKPMNEIVEKLDETFDRWGLDDGKKDIMREIVKGGAE